MSGATWLEIFVLCHNRPEEAKAAIASILAQSTDGFRLIVSDNSSDDRVAAMLQRDFPQVEVRRRGGIAALAHFNLCIGEASTGWFCLFHDDDLMGPEFVAEVQRTSQRYPEAVAIGCNAWIADLQQGSRSLGLRMLGRYQRIDSALALFRRYFGRHQTGFAPFPGYVYRSAAVADERIPEEGGKYADVSWLLCLARRGPIVWIAKPLMDYHLHGENDGLQESLRDRLRFLGFIKACGDCVDRPGLLDYRYFLYKKVLASGRGGRARRRLLRRYVKQARLRRHLRLGDLKALLRKTLIKNLSGQGG